MAGWRFHECIINSRGDIVMQSQDVINFLVQHMTENGTKEDQAKEWADKIIELGYVVMDQLTDIPLEDLTDDVGMPKGQARSLLTDINRELGESQESAPAATNEAPQQPQNITVTMEDHDVSKKPLKALLQMVAEGNRDPEVVNAIHDKVGGVAMIGRENDGKTLDVEFSVKAYNHISQNGVTDRVAGRILETIRKFVHENPEADPWEGGPLMDGVSNTGADWNPVSRERRRLAAFAAEAGLIEVSSMDSFTVIDQVNDETPLSPRWKMVQNNLNAAQSNNRSLVLQAEERLIHHMEAGSSAAPFASAESGRRGPAQQQSQPMTEEEARGILRGLSSGNEHSSGKYDNISGVVGILHVSGKETTLNVVCLEGGRISGKNVSGVVYLPPGKNLQKSGKGCTVDKRCMSYVQLLQVARQILGIDQGSTHISAGSRSVTVGGNVRGSHVVTGDGNKTGVEGALDDLADAIGGVVGKKTAAFLRDIRKR
jgi:hypothetical protein